MLTWIDWLMILGYFGVLAGVVVFSLRRTRSNRRRISSSAGAASDGSR